MKGIIDGKIYDTEKAQEIASDWEDDVSETLYRTEKGEYFLYTQRIISLTKGEALAWCEENEIDSEVIEKEEVVVHG